jgi:hypothetical protein
MLTSDANRYFEDEQALHERKYLAGTNQEAHAYDDLRGRIVPNSPS